MARFRDLYNAPAPVNPCWLSGGVLPKGGIMLMGGYAKIGKTFLLLDMAHGLATGGKLWGTDIKAPSPVAVYYWEQEVGEIEFQRRVKMRYDWLQQQPPDTLFYSSRARDFFVDSPRTMETIKKEIDATGAKVVIVDPVGRSMLGDENSNTDVGALFHCLDELIIARPEVSVVISHHFGKPARDPDAATDPLSPYNFRGASKWFDAPDTLVTFAPMVPHPGEWKRLKARMEVRQGEPITDVTVIVQPGGIVAPAPVSAAALKPAKGWRP